MEATGCVDDEGAVEVLGWLDDEGAVEVLGRLDDDPVKEKTSPCESSSSIYENLRLRPTSRQGLRGGVEATTSSSVSSSSSSAEEGSRSGQRSCLSKFPRSVLDAVVAGFAALVDLLCC